VSDVRAGRYAIRVSAPGYRTRKEFVAVQARLRAAVDIALSPLPGALTVTAPADAQVLVDGVRVAVGPVRDHAVPAGKHLVVVQFRTGAPFVREVVVGPGRLVTMRASPSP